MISSDMIFNTFSFVMLALLAIWGGCFFVFTYKKNDGPKVGKESFLYFNFMFFRRGMLSNIALSSLVLAYIAAAISEFRKNADDIMLVANLLGSASFILFGIYGRYFYQDCIDEKKPLFFIEIFLSKLDFAFGSAFLWLSRITYLTWVVVTVSH